MQARYYDPVIGRFYSNDPVRAIAHLGRTGGINGFNRYAYANNNPYKYIDPDGRETFLVTTRDFKVGSHSALITQRDGKSFLYDPSGSFTPQSGEIRGSGDYFETADLSEYVEYHLDNGSDVSVVPLSTTVEQEKKIESNVIGAKSSTPGLCSVSVAGALSGVVDAEPSFLPGNLEDDVLEAVTEKDEPDEK